MHSSVKDALNPKHSFTIDDLHLNCKTKDFSYHSVVLSVPHHPVREKERRFELEISNHSNSCETLQTLSNHYP